MISVAEALSRLFALAPVLDTETVALDAAAGRVLRSPVRATRDQPPFDAASMDGYAVRGADAVPGARLAVIGTAAAGARFDAGLGPGEAVRIFTGAPLPQGAGHVVIQENTARDGDRVTLVEPGEKPNIRPAGCDFRAGDSIGAPRRLRPVDLALIAAMNAPSVTVSRRPTVAVITTGDELVMPGGQPRDDQIIASNALALAALLRSEGAEPRLLPIAADRDWALAAAFDLARGADLIVTIGGASVGDHDLVASAGRERGLALDFHKVAMRPGKPLMSGRIDGAMMVGLPGNPVSTLVCGHVFLRPVLRAMQGLAPEPLPTRPAPLARALGPNGPRAHYMRARRDDRGGIVADDRQDSALLSVLSDADALLVRPPHDPARDVGEIVNYLPL